MGLGLTDQSHQEPSKGMSLHYPQEFLPHSAPARMLAGIQEAILTQSSQTTKYEFNCLITV
jgi:hypothetical protein